MPIRGAVDHTSRIPAQHTTLKYLQLQYLPDFGEYEFVNAGSLVEHAIALDPTVLAIEIVGFVVSFKAFETTFRVVREQTSLAVSQQSGAKSLAMLVAVDHHEVDEITFADTKSNNCPVDLEYPAVLDVFAQILIGTPVIDKPIDTLIAEERPVVRVDRAARDGLNFREIVYSCEAYVRNGRHLR